MVASRKTLLADLPSRVAGCLKRHVLPGQDMVVGLSGGCDSVVLLNLLVSLAQPARVSAVHVHHGLSPNADDWLAFCQVYCDLLGVTLHCRYASVDRTSGLGIEAAARAARYAAFADVVPKGGVLMLAHHHGDQAETMLFNLLRGCGVNGAAAMREQRYLAGLSILRPLLTTTRDEIESWAVKHQLAWINDESNDDRRFSRNFLRHEILPILRQRFPAAERALGRASSAFAEAADLLDELAGDDWLKVRVGDHACLSALRRLSSSRLKNLLRWRLRQLNWQPPAAVRMDEFVRQLQTAGPDRHPRLVLPSGQMHVAAGLLHWVAKH